MGTAKLVLTCTALLGWVVCRPSFGQESAEERPNLVTQSLLPSGKGLAARFRGDRGIESHPAMIFADSFEEGDYRFRWDSCRDKNGNVCACQAAVGPSHITQFRSESPLRTLHV
jgi:hypothetical protein